MCYSDFTRTTRIMRIGAREKKYMDYSRKRKEIFKKQSLKGFIH